MSPTNAKSISEIPVLIQFNNQVPIHGEKPTSDDDGRLL